MADIKFRLCKYFLISNPNNVVKGWLSFHNEQITPQLLLRLVFADTPQKVNRSQKLGYEGIIFHLSNYYPFVINIPDR